ncbi:hypothetical protein VKT23_009468 [Stygiomarasmius scandens]|uniref:DUF6818 domain-containing protein n=1 Tax=Marasmiellus scandens TaxID=2682957 RepID=A0ABR1JJR2_9AGAR
MSNQTQNGPFRDENGTEWIQNADGTWIQRSGTLRLPSISDAFRQFNTQQSPLSNAFGTGQDFLSHSFTHPPVPSIQAPGPARPPFAPLDNHRDPPATHTVHAASSHCDPANIPLPEDNDNDFPPPHRILPQVARPASRAGGSRRSDPKGKGKAKAADDDAEGLRKSSGIKRKGRQVGASNYSDEDLEILLGHLRERLPLGEKGWKDVTELYNKDASEIGRPIRTWKSLETKFKQLAKTRKPTGDAEIPPYVREAIDIEELMNEKAGTRDLDDEGFVNDSAEADGDEADDEVENVPPVKKVKIQQNMPHVQGPIARRGNPPERRRTSTQDFLSTITHALDPAAQMAQEDAQSTRSLQTTQLIMLNGQVRDLQRTVDNLRQQLAAAERRADRAEARADRADLMNMIRSERSDFSTPSSSTSFRRQSSPAPIRRTVQRETIYPEGGRAVAFLEPGDSPRTREDFYRVADDPFGTSSARHYYTEMSPTPNNESEGSVHEIPKDHSPSPTEKQYD